MQGVAKNIIFFCQHRRLPLRDRYWKRGDGRLRLRYALAGYMSASALTSFVILSMLPLMGAATMSTSSQNVIQTARVEQPITTEITRESALLAPAPIVVASTSQVLPSIKPSVPNAVPLPQDWRADDGQIRRSIATRSTAAIIQNAEEKQKPRIQHLTIAAGDTLSTLLVQAGMNSTDTMAAIDQLRRHVRPSDLRPGQTIDLHLKPVSTGYDFERLALSIDPIRTIEVKRGLAGFYQTEVTEKPLTRDVGAGVAIVKSSLYGSAEAAGIPGNVTAEAIKAFAHQFDFQRDIQPGDRFEIMYDRMVTDDGYVARNGNLVYARLQADGRDVAIYRFENNDGRVDYFDREGKSIRKALLRTPMDSIRITSGFGMRRHPLLGYSKMHKGVDFGAPTGTPVYAAGDAVVEKAGRFGAYGNYIRLRHTNIMKTAYAHLSRYGEGIRPGARVRQGQVIGYVGTTGRSTGPHLHYEVILRGEQANPQSVKLPTMVVLEGSERKKFKELVHRVDANMKKHLGVDVASTSKPAPLR